MTTLISNSPMIPNLPECAKILSERGGAGMSMMFEDRDAYAIAESEARKAIGGLDPGHVSAERGVEFDRVENRFRVPMLGEVVAVGTGDGRGAGGRRGVFLHSSTPFRDCP